MPVKDILGALVVVYCGWQIGTWIYKRAGIHEIELFANSLREEGK